MTKKEAEIRGYKVIAASPFEVGLIKGEKGIRTWFWFCQDFDRKLPPLDHPEILRAIEVNEEFEREHMKKAREIDSKFAVSTEGKIYKKSNGEVIPDDEPLFLLRGRDLLAIKFLMAYAEISKEAGCNAYHFLKIGETTGGFIKFKIDYPERMKMPSITEGK